MYPISAVSGARIVGAGTGRRFRLVEPTEGGTQAFSPPKSMALPAPFTQFSDVESNFTGLHVGRTYLVTAGMQFSVDTIITGFRLELRRDGVTVVSHHNSWSHLINAGGNVETLFLIALLTPTSSTHELAPYVARFAGAATLYMSEWSCALYGPLGRR